jgi:hypothetical protein
LPDTLFDRVLKAIPQFVIPRAVLARGICFFFDSRVA